MDMPMEIPMGMGMAWVWGPSAKHDGKLKTRFIEEKKQKTLTSELWHAQTEAVQVIRSSDV